MTPNAAPRPPSIPDELRIHIVARSCPDQLMGSLKQIEFAGSIRKGMLAIARHRGPAELVDLLCCIRDSTWFIANRGKPLGRLEWPSPTQMRGPETDDSARCGVGPRPVEYGVNAKAPTRRNVEALAKTRWDGGVTSAPALDRQPEREASIRVRTSYPESSR